MRTCRMMKCVVPITAPTTCWDYMTPMIRDSLCNMRNRGAWQFHLSSRTPERTLWHFYVTWLVFLVRTFYYPDSKPTKGKGYNAYINMAILQWHNSTQASSLSFPPFISPSFCIREKKGGREEEEEKDRKWGLSITFPTFALSPAREINASQCR